MDYPFVNIHTHSRTGEGIEMLSSMALGGVLPELPCSVGIHPWQIGAVTSAASLSGSTMLLDTKRCTSSSLQSPEEVEAALKEVETAHVSAIGEIGLDYAKSNNRGVQQVLFANQLRIAQERGLPVILHCVKAFEPVMEILHDFRLPAVIFHGFIGSPEQAKRAIHSGYYLSFGPNITRSGRTVIAMSETPVEQMFLETDQFEMKIDHLYTGAARLLVMDLGELKKQIYQNYRRIFEK